MKKILALIGLAVGLSYATETRVMTMGFAPEFIVDEFYVLQNPSVITSINSMYLFELGDTTLAPRYAGVFWTGGDPETGRQGIGLYLRKNTLLEGFTYTFPVPQLGFGFVAGKDFGKFSLGTSIYYSQETDNYDVDSTYPSGTDTVKLTGSDKYTTSNMTFVLGAGLKYAEMSFFQASFAYAKHGYSDETNSTYVYDLDPADSTPRLNYAFYRTLTEGDGASSMAFSARAFHFLNEKFALIPALGYRTDNFSTTTPHDSMQVRTWFPDSTVTVSDTSEDYNVENKGNNMGFGLAANIYPVEGATIMFGFSGNMSSQDLNFLWRHADAVVDSALIDTLENHSTKRFQFVTGAEVPVFRWLCLRGSMRKTILGKITDRTTVSYHDGAPDNTETEETTIDDDLAIWIGLGIKIGSFTIDGNLDPLFLYHGPYVIGGDDELGFLNVSAKYTF